MRASWEELTAGLSEQDVSLLELYRDYARRLPDVEEEIHGSQIQYRRARIFSSAYVKSHYLEIAVELLREASHPKLRTSFASTKKITLHRITLSEPGEFDEPLRELIREAAETVGPGTR